MPPHYSLGGAAADSACLTDHRLFGGIRNGIETGKLLPGRESSLKTNVGVCQSFILALICSKKSIDVGVVSTAVFCGPAPLAKSLKEETKAASSSSINFKLYKEHF